MADRTRPLRHSYFVSYEVVKKYMTPANAEGLSLGAVILAGGMAGIAMWSVAIPPDVRRLARCHACSVDADATPALPPDHQVAPPVGAERDVQGLCGLHAAAHRQGRRGRAMEGIRPGGEWGLGAGAGRRRSRG